MERVLVFGRGGAGKSTMARHLAGTTGLPLVELDREFWNDALDVMPLDEWRARQRVLAAPDRWIMDGDLGSYDDVAPRMARTDTVVIVDLPLAVCAWRAWRRGRERRDFWVWTLHWRRRNLPSIHESIGHDAPTATVVTLRTRRAVRAWLTSAQARMT
jgi:adenylate kinase family enzyme